MLNVQQQQAVDHIKWPLLINAGAGSGKTHTIIERIIKLILDGEARPEEIFAVTFTNKAAKWMKDRIATRIQTEWISWMPILWTFHSLAARYLRTYWNLLWYDKAFSIYDDWDVTKLMKTIFKEMELAELDLDVSLFKDKIDKFKTFWFSLELIEKNIKKDLDRIIFEFYQEYQKRIFNDNAMDFNDLLINFLEILKIPEVMSRFNKQFKYFFVDEYQDTNMIQYNIMKLLSAHTRNLCVIWDDYQSIYSFRNADMKNILNFTKDYPEAVVINLEQNYRSTQTIVNSANEVIKNNTIRLDKKLFSMWDIWTPIKVFNLNNSLQEADNIAKEILKTWMPKKWAILYRNNYISRIIEQSLINSKIPYRVFGWLVFVERMEIKDIMWYINLIVNKKDSNSFKRVINTPTRWLWAKGVADILDIVKQQYSGNFHKVIEEPSIVSNSLKGKAKIWFEEFINIMKNLKEASDSVSVGDLISMVIKEIGYLEYLEKNYNWEEFDDKKQNLGELVSMWMSYEWFPGYEGIIEFVEKIALMQDANEHKDDNAEFVSLMTIHKSKWLEFENVAVVAVEDGILPSKNSIETLTWLEEERRLMYVAMTRAKENLFLSYVGERMIFWNYQYQQPSRFLNEIPEKYIHNVWNYY